MQKMPSASLIYPHQLFDPNPILAKERVVFLVEDPLFFSQYAFHRQKLMLHRASMKRYEQYLRKRKFDIRYVEASELRSTEDIATIVSQSGFQAIYVVDPEDDYAFQKLAKGCKREALLLEIVPDPNFLTPTEEMEQFVAKKKSLFFTSFYIEQRKRLQCLLDSDGSPLGGKWSFDTENRKRLPKGHPIPKMPTLKEDSFAKEARDYVRNNFPNAVGSDEPLIYPTSHEAALAWLDNFIENRLASFGDFEDAIAKNETILFHSCLTPMLNIGLISPQAILDRVNERADTLGLNSLEGFVRQVIGWREYVRLVYRHYGGKQRTTNFWNFSRTIPRSFYDGTTGVEPVDTVIHRVLETGYCHHIERLMILGNFMLLCEFHPDEVYRWFMELFIDAYDWVMVPNVYGMSQHADGGLMTTKPYISGSSYVLRMSDFKRGPWCDVWDALYWNFINKHRTFFEGNPRMMVMTRQLDRMGDKLESHRQNATHFLENLG
jgi:deoxyribodipyrimidine photolyase-related protein